MKREIEQARPEHKVVSREQWLLERMHLLREEKELTRRSDELARRRQALPWVRVDKDYRFDTEQGSASLAELFNGRSQLLLYHFMFGPQYAAGCPSCSSIADGFNGCAMHLAEHDVTLMAVSRAPLEKLLDYRRRMDWAFPWASSFGSDFNVDFAVGITETQQREGGAEYNYRREPAMPAPGALDGTQAAQGSSADDGESPVAQFARMCGTDPSTYIRERPGMSAFVLEDGVVHHSYSTYARGLDALWGMYPWLDRAPKGRNETGVWWRRHDEYESAAVADCCRP
ncbi:MAG: thioredoxin family protein [Dokdonella sp.]